MTASRRPPGVRIGGQLRAARTARGLTIDSVARATGLTKGFISRMERDEVSASVTSLVALCEVLGIRVGQLFDAPESTLVRADEGKPVNFGAPGAREWVISPGSERRLEVIRSLIAPGGGGDDQLYVLKVDVEFLVLLRGSLEVLMTGETVTLQAGDSFTLTGHEPHSWRNPSATEHAELLWVLTPAP